MSMKWQEARRIAAGHLRRLQLPDRLDGVTVRLAECAEPGAPEQAQRMINQAFAREVRKRGGTVLTTD